MFRHLPLEYWMWNAKTGDGERYEAYANFEKGGTYRVQISARSHGFAIDRFVLYRTSLWTEQAARKTNLKETTC